MSHLKSYSDVLNTQTSVPNQLMPESSSKLMECRSEKLYITPTNSQTATDNGNLTFQLPSGNGRGWLQPSTLALEFVVSGISTGAADAVEFSHCTNSGSSMINRVTVSVGGQQIEQILNYAQWSAIVGGHMTSSEYQTHDQTILERNDVVMVSAATIFGDRVLVPLNVGCLSTEKALPLWLFQSNINISIDFNSSAMAFHNTTGGTVTSFTVTQPRLYYTCLHTEQAYYDSIRAMLASGKLFSVYMNQIMSQSASHLAGSTLTVNSGLSLSSLCTVFSTQILTVDMTSTARKSFPSNGQTDIVLYTDGTRALPYPVSNEQIAFYELEKAIGNYQDSNVTSLATNDSYGAHYYVNGFDLRRCNSDRFTHMGIPVSQARIEIVGAIANATQYSFWVYSSELLIDVNGAVVVSR